MKAAELIQILQRVPAETELRVRVGEGRDLLLSEAVYTFSSAPIAIDPKASFAEQASAYVQVVFVGAKTESYPMQRVAGLPDPRNVEKSS
jgi:hypothetical protein